MNKKEKDIRRFIMVMLLITVCFFSVAYAVLAENLDITGTSNIDASWNVLITDIESEDIVGTATNASSPTVLSPTSASFGANLLAPGDSITYAITIENKGTIDAKLSDIILSDSTNNENGNIKYTLTGVEKGITSLKVNEVNKAYLRVYYDASGSSDNLEAETKNISVSLLYEQK